MHVSKALYTLQAHLHCLQALPVQVHIAKLGMLELAVAACAEWVQRTVVAHGAGKVIAPGSGEAWAAPGLVAVDGHLVCVELLLVLPLAAGPPRAGAEEIVVIAKRLAFCHCEFSFVGILGWNMPGRPDRWIKTDIVLIQVDVLDRLRLGRTNINILVVSGATSRSIAPLILERYASIT